MRRLGLFVIGLVLVFGASFAVGSAVDGGDDSASPRAGHAEDSGHGGHGGHGGTDLRLELDDGTFPAGREDELAFRVVGPDGAPIRSFEEKHTKPLHLVVVRRDLTFFEHVHPQPDAEGTWRTRLRLDSPGDYRVIADVTHEGTDLALAADLEVPGEPLPFSAPRSEYDVAMTADGLRAGRPETLRFTVRRDGRPVRTQPYLGAAGHLVAMAAQDLEYLHVHPELGELAFEATFSEPGPHVLFLEYRHAGEVRVERLEVEVGS